MKNLVIVESPAKAKTIMKYLGRSYKVVASMGHVRDLPKSQMGVDLDHDFQPKYINIRGKAPLINSLKKEAKAVDKVLLATDPDREGEAISWHLAHILGLEEKEKNRITFNEITKSAVKEALKHAREIDQNLVDAQQARRVIDRVVGYKLSPFLWKKVRRGLSAGRVQSVATKMVVDREQEIRNFIPVEYWSVDALFPGVGAKSTFAAKLYARADETKVEIADKAAADQILADLDGAEYRVRKVKKGKRTRNPAPPFTTSTLQQEASRRLGFMSRRTMSVAQTLYEGVDIKGAGVTGLITYMRTDSLRISAEALEAARGYIGGAFGADYLPEKARVFRASRNAQDAHEAIRPTSVELTPAAIKDSLSADQYKLYKLIWERFVASQMQAQRLNTVSVDIAAADYLFRASGFTVEFAGFTVLYEESREEKNVEGAKKLPEMSEGELLKLLDLISEQHFTQPPARYTEATLIKELEENGIGRPSTYSPTISTILQRGYVERDKRTLAPTQLGEITTQLMSDYFKDIVDVEFTANVENELDKIAEGDEAWVDAVKHFYGDFARTLETAEKELGDTRIDIPDRETDIVCEKCGRKMVIKMGRYGEFLACPGYPECKNTKPIQQDTGVACPKCGGKILVKKSKKGKKYFGCEHNPGCDFMSWDQPVKDKCPKCGGLLLQKPGRSGKIYCYNSECDYEGEKA